MNRYKCPACGGDQYTSADTAEGCIYCGHKELKKMEILEPKEGEGMREIKFRGKRLDNGEWVYGYYYTQIITHAGNRKSRDHFMRTEQNIRYEVDPETVGQYTELPDRNNEPLFEGDIIKSIYTSKLYFIAWGDNKDRQPAGFVKIPINHYTSNIELSYIDARAFEKIGNLWDNPELLKEGSEVEK